MIINSIEKNPHLVGILKDTLSYNLNKSLRDLFLIMEERHKNDIHNCLLYWAKFFLMTLDKNYDAIPELKNEFISNVDDSDVTRNILLFYLEFHPYFTSIPIQSCVKFLVCF